MVLNERLSLFDSGPDLGVPTEEEARVVPKRLELQRDDKAIRSIVEGGDGAGGVAVAVQTVHAGAGDLLGTGHGERKAAKVRQALLLYNNAVQCGLTQHASPQDKFTADCSFSSTLEHS